MNNDKGEVWVQKTLLQLWDFCSEMWEHRNAVLHNTKLESSRKMKEAETNDVITKLYEQVDTYSAEDQWYFDIPLATRLHKPLQLRLIGLLMQEYWQTSLNNVRRLVR
jgi:hypothetical protein